MVQAVLLLNTMSMVIWKVVTCSMCLLTAGDEEEGPSAPSPVKQSISPVKHTKNSYDYDEKLFFLDTLNEFS